MRRIFGTRRIRHLNDRVRKAREEVEKSRASLERTRKHVVTPLDEWRERNHFADLIKASLLEGRGH